MLGVVLHPEAVAEALAAKAWYQERSLRAAQAFVRELGRVMEQLQASPLRWPAGAHGMRRILLRRFPFGIVYRLTPATIQVIAVMHLHRRPGYWKRRG
ncbi:MAG: type II toxin-antitoxin system RelE/ParE family toxin [Planctomycetes bacterium]|nr:type II toxin-antitoxin system RelE/ParE family toxin [Planctomycetota bacterium]